MVHAALDDPEEGLSSLIADGWRLRALPGHLVPVVVEIFLAASSPAKSHFHGVAITGWAGGIFGAFVECHDDVCAQADLCLYGSFGGEEMRRSVEMRAKRHAIFSDPC